MSDIAIVGLDGRFPGASDPAAFWELLMRGGDAISAVPDGRWDPARTGVVSGGFLPDVDAFDPGFFGIPPREAESMDPQQRLMLQSTWRAFEDACLDPRRQAGTSTGVFVGVMGNEWAHRLSGDLERITPYTGSGNGQCMIANRLSYQLDLTGPSMAIDTACSSSLVALHQACVALRAGECDQAVAGGVSVMVTPALNVFYRLAGLSSPDGACRPFSREANGIVRSEAVAALILRRVEDAVADGLPIYAVVKGGAVNQNGRGNGLTAPNRRAQRAVLTEAYRRAGVLPGDVVAVEAHGTGTALGDLIEVNALGDVHAVDRSHPCALGSVKGNIGHAEGAAGIAAVVKMALALHHGVIPASRHARTEDPRLGLGTKGLRLLKAPMRLSDPRSVVGVSGFGLGGTNAHLVLAGHAAAAPAPVSSAPGVLTLSAESPEGLLTNAEQLSRDIAAAPDRHLGQLCWSSNQVKSSGRHRLAIVATSRAQAVAALDGCLRGEAPPESVTGASTAPPMVGWLFSGQSGQHPGMTMALYDNCAQYSEALAEADKVLAPLLERSIVRVLTERTPLDDAVLAQAALFAVGYALGRVLDDLGAGPEWMIGHSVGEYSAAVFAEVLSLEDAARLVTARAGLMRALPVAGGMLAVRCSPEALEPLLRDESTACLAVVNTPEDVVCSGAVDALDRIASRLRESGVDSRRLDVSHAFHSPLMEPMLDRFAEVAAAIDYRPARRTVYSTLYGRLLAEDERMDAEYWVRHVREPVRFADAFGAALRHGATQLVELGPRPVLSSLVRRTPGADGIPVHAPGAGPDATGLELLSTAARLYCGNVDPQWAPLYAPPQRVLHRLTPYRFSRAHRSWVRPSEPHETVADPVVSETRLPAHDVDGLSAAVLAILAGLGGREAHEVRAETRLADELGFDSMMLVELKGKLEELCGRTIAVDALADRTTTAGDLIGFVREVRA